MCSFIVCGYYNTRIILLMNNGIIDGYEKFVISVVCKSF